jgi:para-aminobenzoate synthetase/4-amino-4-deoxychorismate lyase
MRDFVFLHDAVDNRWLSFTNPVEVVSAAHPGDIQPALARVERLVQQQGLWAAGFLAYESAPAFDPAMQTHTGGGMPLLWFGLYANPTPAHLPDPAPIPRQSFPQWTPNLAYEAYQQKIAAVKAFIAEGETYQVNFTIRLHGHFAGDPWQYFLHLAAAQQSQYAAFIQTGSHAVCSASPELFFELNGRRLRSRPMKGTAARGRLLAEDNARQQALQSSQKDRAENVMIVDMIRNDMGRIANIGTVKVPALFEIETYPTVLQMTSTVECETDASISEIFEALFPCASITGAPKIRTMDIIRCLEDAPRGIYTGSIGYLRPDRQAQFNIAIRTAVINLENGNIEYGTGGGIVWDSDPELEFRECEIKARVLHNRRPPFELLESILWAPEGGYFLLERHLDRLEEAGLYFGIPVYLEAVRAKLEDYAAGLSGLPHKIRLRVDRCGNIYLEAHPEPGIKPPLGFLPPENPTAYLQAAVALEPVDPDNPFLFHKTTNRDLYTRAQEGKPGVDHVLLWNTRGEVTEFTTANLVLRLGGRLVTPSLACGLLPGTLRAELMARGIIVEQIITRADIAQAEEAWAINAVRGWQPVVWDGGIRPID